MPRILVVDDDSAFRDGLAETLRDLGHDVAEAASGDDGLASWSPWPNQETTHASDRPEHPPRVDGTADGFLIGAWPGNGLLDRQLGPNRNGRTW